MDSGKDSLVNELYFELVQVISESNGISLPDTLELLSESPHFDGKGKLKKLVDEFRRLLAAYQYEDVEIETLLGHPVALGLYEFFKKFPLKYKEEHIHLTGSLSADFIFPRLKKLLEGENRELYEERISEIYGEDALPIESVEDVDRLIRLAENEYFDRYLQILYLPKLILTDRSAHEEAAFHMASELYEKYNVGSIRLKFTLSRETNNAKEQVPGIENLTSDDVVMGLYGGFKKFQGVHPNFTFQLSPCFRKESDHFDSKKYATKKDHFIAQVDELLELMERYPELEGCLTEVDTVGNERDLYRKEHFFEMQKGFRKLQYKGFRIRSHHGETWHTLNKGIQAVDNAMNIWHIDTLEHGLSLGVNPNYYFQGLYQRVVRRNMQALPLNPKSVDYREIMEMDWSVHPQVLDKLLNGVVLHSEERTKFLKTKFHTAREVESYQHDVLNRLLTKKVNLTSLPSSNKKLTNYFFSYKDHPFSWWEKKGMILGVGTDNYITLNTNYILEVLKILFSDPEDLKITKLLMITTGETRRAYISQLLWQMRENTLKGLD
ncbi:MAG: hypothetical protein KDD61_06000 [Bdellovibrionales bacterium]|nr:hypothetical protein [Bdellovibrionales bacterium]